VKSENNDKNGKVKKQSENNLEFADEVRSLIPLFTFHFPLCLLEETYASF